MKELNSGEYYGVARPGLEAVTSLLEQALQILHLVRTTQEQEGKEEEGGEHHMQQEQQQEQNQQEGEGSISPSAPARRRASGFTLRNLLGSAAMDVLGEASRELREVRMDTVPEKERLCFIVNLHNLLLLHAMSRAGPPNNPIQRLQLYTQYCYRVGDLGTLNLNEIEHALLRGPSARASFFGASLVPKFGPGHPKHRFVLKAPVPLLSFVLASGTKCKQADQHSASTPESLPVINPFVPFAMIVLYSAAVCLLTSAIGPHNRSPVWPPGSSAASTNAGRADARSGAGVHAGACCVVRAHAYSGATQAMRLVWD